MAERKEFRSIAEALDDVAYRKRRAAEVCFAGTPPGVEAPREVYLAACHSIGLHLEETLGFKYAKSGPHARRKCGDLTFQVSFQSSHNNIAGERIALWIHGNVWSARLKRWREGRQVPHASEYVAGGQIGNLQVPTCWLDWDLADSAKRDMVIRDAVHSIESLALPYFARFEDLSSLFKLLVNEDLPAMDIDRVMDFLVCFADVAVARSAAANYLARHPDFIDAYQRDFTKYAGTSVAQQTPSGYAQKLAHASHVLGFGDLTQGLSTR